MDSMDPASQLAAKQAEAESLRYTLEQVRAERDKYKKAFYEVVEKYENLLNQLGATDA